MLISALYEMGEWASPFPVAETQKDRFYGSNGESTVDMMHLDNEFCSYFEGENWESIDLAFKGRKTVAKLVLPKGGVDIEDFSKNLPTDVLRKRAVEEIAFGMKETELYLPRF